MRYWQSLFSNYDGRSRDLSAGDDCLCPSGLKHNNLRSVDSILLHHPGQAALKVSTS